MPKDSSRIWDPLRKKEVAATPEERVRQWFIGVLRDNLGVPEHMMMSEVGMKLGQKDFRADILVYSKAAAPVLIVECKRPDVTLDGKVIDQALRYNMVLDVKHIVITNGTKTYIFSKEDSTFVQKSTFPCWDDLK
ncbi:MAG: type I restriction enzyme HsdR N-terminal domain-containing protein [Bacteroidales bacterium]|nr:type I restriction enzyme HsdR N-terminal domain-containing protein [Bacteroidales bacterium]